MFYYFMFGFLSWINNTEFYTTFDKICKFEREENTPGTPVDMENDDSEENSEKEYDDRIFDGIDNVNVGNVEKAHNGLITTVYVFDVKYCNERGAYRGSISDGVKFSTNVFFYPKISAAVQNDLEDKVSIVKLEITEIIKKCVVAVSM